MKYLRMSLVTKTDEILYEKDVEVRNVMDPFVRALVSTLVRAKVMQEGDHYVSLIIPRYGDILEHRNPTLAIDQAKANESRHWIELVYEEPVQPAAPVRYFTIELRVRESGLIYRQDFHPHEVAEHYVTYGVTQALVRLRQIQVGDLYLTRFFARDDDQADFDREMMPALHKQASSLVEVMDDEGDGEPSFPRCDPARYGEVQVIGQIDEASIQIYVRREAMNLLIAEGKLSSEAERGGMLIGDVFENAHGGRRIVEISDLVISEHTRASVAELRYTFESWQAQRQLMRERFLGKRMVGWYHTHLVSLPVYKSGKVAESEESGLFFSRDDVFLHSRFFPDEWYVAMVLDPQGGSIFFQWKDGKIVECDGYRVFEDIGVAGAKVGT